MPKINSTQVQTRVGSSYPAPYDQPCQARQIHRLGDAAGLTQFGVHIVCLEPDAWASQRHWHEHEDEFVWVLEGEVTLVEDEGETKLSAGESAGWPAGVRNGHHLINRSNARARFLIVGSRNDEDHGGYSDIDMTFSKGRYSGNTTSVFRHKDGTPYPDR